MRKEKNVGCHIDDNIECFLELNDNYTESYSENYENTVYESNPPAHQQDAFYINYIFQAAPFLVDIFKHVISNFIDFKKAKMQKEALSQNKYEPESEALLKNSSNTLEENKIKESLQIKNTHSIKALSDVYVGCIWADNSYDTIEKRPLNVTLSENIAERLSDYERQKAKTKKYVQVVLKGFMVKDTRLFNYNKDPFTEVIEKSIFDGYIQNNEIPFNYINVCIFNDKQLAFNGLKFFNPESRRWSNFIFKKEGQKILNTLEKKIKI